MLCMQVQLLVIVIAVLAFVLGLLRLVSFGWRTLVCVACLGYWFSVCACARARFACLLIACSWAYSLAGFPRSSRLPCLACLACFACLALPCLALPCLALPCLASPCFALPCLALLCLALPCFVLPCLAAVLAHIFRQLLGLLCFPSYLPPFTHAVASADSSRFLSSSLREGTTAPAPGRGSVDDGSGGGSGGGGQGHHSRGSSEASKEPSVFQRLQVRRDALFCRARIFVLTLGRFEVSVSARGCVFRDFLATRRPSRPN